MSAYAIMQIAIPMLYEATIWGLMAFTGILAVQELIDWWRTRP